MFLGTYTPRLDEKSRLILPAKFRDELSDGLVLTRGQERCVYVFSMEEFQRVHNQMREAPLSSRQARDYIRVFLSGASDETPDKQGRITIPAPLREYAGLDRDVAVVALARAEIWDQAAWNRNTSRRRNRHSRKPTRRSFQDCSDSRSGNDINQHLTRSLISDLYPNSWPVFPGPGARMGIWDKPSFTGR